MLNQPTAGAHPAQLQGMPIDSNNAAHARERSHADLGSPFASVAGKGVYITFQWHMIALTTIDPEKNGKRERRLVLMRQPIGDPSTSSATYITEKQAAEFYPAEWEYFSKYSDMPTNGTALSELPGISSSQIQIMNLGGLRSIEDVLQVEGSIIDRIGFEARYVHTLATAWKARKDDSQEMIDFSERSAQLSVALSSEKEARERAERANADLVARLSALEAVMGGKTAVSEDLQPSPPPAAADGYDAGPPIEDMPTGFEGASGLEADEDILGE